MTNWRTTAIVAIASICLTLLAVKYLNPANTPEPSVNYGQLIQIQELSLLEQTNNYSDLTAGTYKFRIAGTTRLYCKWQATYYYGLDSLDTWDWETEYNKEERVYRVVSPRIKFLRANLAPVNCQSIKKGLFVNHDKYRNDIEKSYQKQAEIDGKSKEQEGEIQRLGKLSLESHLLSILRDANFQEPATRVIVTFKDEDDVI